MYTINEQSISIGDCVIRECKIVKVKTFRIHLLTTNLCRLSTPTRWTPAVSRVERGLDGMLGRGFGFTYLDQLSIVSSWVLSLEPLSATFLVTEERRHWLFWGILILLDTLLLHLLNYLRLCFLCRSCCTCQISE